MVVFFDVHSISLNSWRSPLVCEQPSQQLHWHIRQLLIRRYTTSSMTCIWVKQSSALQLCTYDIIMSFAIQWKVCPCVTAIPTRERLRLQFESKTSALLLYRSEWKRQCKRDRKHVLIEVAKLQHALFADSVRATFVFVGNVNVFRLHNAYSSCYRQLSICAESNQFAEYNMLSIEKSR